MLAGRWLGLTTVLHEQNALLGRTNRLLARGRVKVAASYPGVGDRLVGNPVRPEIAALRNRPLYAPAAGEPLRLLVFGGSQGARIFSEVLPEALGPLAGRVVVRQQCRTEDLEAARSAYRRQGVEASWRPSSRTWRPRSAKRIWSSRAREPLPSRNSRLRGRPAIFAPYPHATDDHQSANARAVIEAGGGWLLPDRDFTPDRLRELVDACLAEPDRLARAAAGARQFGRPDAADALVDFVLSEVREAGS